MPTALASGPGHGRRRDIQGLRTLAVGMVIGYHLFPSTVPGGFVGVDVFFVISGFLIVGSLVREVTSSHRINLAAFYARRIRRLLPAATLVLLATMAGTVLLLPQGRWQGICRDLIMSALQMQNWNQAFSSNSYAAATELVSPFQHYWSLAVEEQFYIVIPLLLLGAAACRRILQLRRDQLCLWLLILLSAASLWHSTVFSASSHDIAYFATSTRIWELGAGGIAALLLPRLKVRCVLGVFCAGWLGLALILASGVTYSTQMAFPGYVAVVPVLGAVLILWSGSVSRTGTGSGAGTGTGWVFLSDVLSVRPVAYLGDISYSLYLWHWPLIVFYVFRSGKAPRLVEGAVLVAVSIGLAILSYRFVEQRFRYGKVLQQSRGRRSLPVVHSGRAYLLAATLVASSLLVAAGPWVLVQAKADQLGAEADSANYPGALAFGLRDPAAVPPGLPVKPDPGVAGKDRPMTQRDKCNVYDPAVMGEGQCYYGDLAADKTAVLIGDSHAGQYLDPLAAIGRATGWKIHAMVRNGCPFSAVPPASATTVYTNCSKQNEDSLRRILQERPGMVVVSGMTAYGYEQALHWSWKHERNLVDGYVSMLRPLVAAGIKVEVILDLPYPPFSVPDCVAMKGTGSQQCAVAPAQRPPDALQQAADKVPGVKTVDFWNYFCHDVACPAVIGNVLVYRDNHMTNTFAETLARPLEAALDW
ncbi:acyltransferase [Paenarthrobacter sp. Z7-10]|uniref:acyltransferase family protein n=1 Tax=Paenarthrobacter sp. Z7-10 TaxID=2787635 RepID=UPI0022A8E16C|nr:acyltransferase family protein [Paenarthrobacter sp. Z7-10]MCZ2402802.1 acyltransferase [Paenarthrobacter sp. Z7-10]